LGSSPSTVPAPISAPANGHESNSSGMSGQKTPVATKTPVNITSAPRHVLFDPKSRSEIGRFSRLSRS
jgi:hypothetical protein